MKYIWMFLFLMGQQSFAQLPDYYVYLITGEATITRPGGKPAGIKQSQLVYKNDIITLKKGAEVTLVDKDASFFVLNAARTYKANALNAGTIKKTNDGITGRYLKLLFHELLDPNQDFEKFKKENIAGVWGGVSRGDDCNNRIFPINGLKTSAATVVFKWHKTSPSSAYSLFIYDANGNEVTKMGVKDSLQPVNINQALQGRPGKYFWRVISVDGNCEDEIPIYFDVLTAENEKKQAAEIATGDEQSMEMQLQRIDKLEKNGYINVASSKYAALVKANPDNKALLKSYVMFLLKYGSDEEARAAWRSKGDL